MVKPYFSEEVLLDPEMRSSEVLDFERRLLGKIVGQDRAVRRIVNMYQIYLAGMAMPGRPIGNLLFLGPTGSGKTRIVEASADILFGSMADHVAPAAVGVLLTGMGDDGAAGLLRMRSAGARTIAQDEDSSAVYGMPREAERLGAAEQVLPLERIAGAVIRAVGAVALK